MRGVDEIQENGRVGTLDLGTDVPVWFDEKGVYHADKITVKPKQQKVCAR
jgi:hypothetical protein